MIAGIVGAGAGLADPSGGASAAALSAVSTISVLFRCYFWYNSTIDLIQEGAAIAGKYLGPH